MIVTSFNMAAEYVTDNHDTIKQKNGSKPQTIFLFSGKRKSGKDFITNALQERIGFDSAIIRLSGPIKSHWAKSLGLDIDLLLGDGAYKENYRCKMAKWGENIRKQDYGYFCRAAIDMYNVNEKLIWIVSDARRKTDLQWFMQNYEGVCKTVRVVSDDSVRMKRGWTFTPGIDDSETECDLDDMDTWDLVVTNNDESIEYILQQILSLVR